MKANADDKTPPEPPAKDKRNRVCPNCGKPRTERYSPFCSKRCADIDLHRWLNGGYVIPGPPLGREPGDEQD